ncbi:calcium-binding protein [Pseudoprimorskyibacter insulae]|uniref:Leukotoxin n=1 Tax=Pseudoprimorskyibacter insulae TaxID=1695997 RepID=A0A2R8AQU7_9RHOB|nr:calcium-binding protein [Pseudoprimorskyibacter insulae]SPF78209.1 Leukotoxin [Pseudoprimorskyibacter insulae]
MASYRFIGVDTSTTGNSSGNLGFSTLVRDINGDGTLDFIIGGSADVSSSIGAQVYVLNGLDLAAADAADGATDQVIDLSNVPAQSGSYRITYSSTTSGFGSSLAYMESVNGPDSTQLLAIGAPQDDTIANNAGAVFLFQAANLAGLDALDGATDGEIDAANATFTFYGDKQNIFLGQTIAGLDEDFTQLGNYDRIAIAAPFSDRGSNVNEGSIWSILVEDLDRLDVLDGTADNKLTLSDAVADAHPINGQNLIRGGTSGVRMGEGVVDVGPVFSTASGFHQIMVGGSGDNGGAGVAYLVSASGFGLADAADGLTDGIIEADLMDGGGGYAFHGVQTPKEDLLGSALGTTGDIDGDGLNDLIIGGRGSDVGGDNAGIVYVMTARSLDAADRLDGQDSSIDLSLISNLTVGAGIGAYRIIGNQRLGEFGFNVSYAGDFDGDGVGDFMALSRTGSSGPTVYMISGASLNAGDAADGTVDGEILVSNLIGANGGFALTSPGKASSKLGSSLNLIGDLDGDGRSDMLIGDTAMMEVGSTVPRGGAYLVSGGSLLFADAVDGTQDGQVSAENLLDTSTAVGLTGTSGNDLLKGGSGNDTINGLDGDDSIYGNLGTDTLIGGAGDDFIFGGPGSGDLRDVVYAGDGNDTVDGGYGNDELRGDAGDDQLSGNFGADLLIGGTGNDILSGGALSDALFGGDGDDFINGGFGFDRLNGSGGGDKFFHQGAAGHGSDWIQDYSAAEGDVLQYGGATATKSDFLVQYATTPTAGNASVQEAFVTHKSTGQLLWALVDGEAQTSINVQSGGTVFDLLA